MSLSPEARAHHDRMHLVWDAALRPRMTDWKARIDVFVPFAAMDEAKISRREIADAIVYITATTPEEVSEFYLGAEGVRYRAAGYRMGPAGDH